MTAKKSVLRIDRFLVLTTVLTAALEPTLVYFFLSERSLVVPRLIDEFKDNR